MESNPYLDHSSEKNPYLKTAVQDAATAQIMQNLAELLTEETAVSVTSPQSPPPSSPCSYVSITETVGTETTDTPEGTTYISCTDHPELIAPQTPYQRSVPSTPLTDARKSLPSQPTSYPSPEAMVQSEQIDQQQVQKRSRQEALKQQRLAQEQAQQAADARRALEKRARQFLAKLDKMHPLESDRMWFEDFARLCPSRLEAAIEFIQTMSCNH